MQKMAFSTAKLSELQLRNSLPLSSAHHSSSSFTLFFKSHKSSISLFKPFSSLKTTNNPKNPNPKSSSNPPKTPPSAPWLSKWPQVDSPPSIPPPIASGQNRASLDSLEGSERSEIRHVHNRGQSAIERIVLRLRNLGLGSDDDEELDELDDDEAMQVTGDEKLGDLLKRDWIRPDVMLVEENKKDLELLPWEKEEYEVEEERASGDKKKRTVKAPTLAELTIEDSELRRLRRQGMVLRERVNVPKAGVTQAVMEKIHDKWRKSELVRLKFHETLAHDMKTAHELTERRTGGLVIWRSGSVMVVYRGNNYEGPSSSSQNVDGGGYLPFIPNVSTTNSPASVVNAATPNVQKIAPALLQQEPRENMTAEEIEYNNMLDGLGPRFVDWWGTGVLPVDGDLLPQTLPDFKPPLRLLPVGMRSRLTNAELTNLRKLAKSLPCHFALGRNRHHQGLAAAIIKLWETSLVVKIAVKRGIQNTNNELMSEELKRLTGGVLLLRNKYYIVFYRGKDFLPKSVAAALAERQEMTKQIQDAEEAVRTRVVQATPLGEVTSSEESVKAVKQVDATEKGDTIRVQAALSNEDGQALAGTLAEFYQSQARWGREISSEERRKMIEEASRSTKLREIKRIKRKFATAQAKKLRAEKLLSKIEASMIPVGPSDDQETITDEERFMFRRVGLRMKAYLPLGIRGIFDGVIENMHLHWKHRELVKLITKQKTLEFVEDTARLLEYESGGILVAIERVPKGFALIYYRGKNYKRPISLRPRNLLTKAKALKRAVAMQRHEALSQHISELEQNMEHMMKQIGDSQDTEDGDAWSSDPELDPLSEITKEDSMDEDDGGWSSDPEFDPVSELTQNEDENPEMDSDDESNVVFNPEADETSAFSSIKNDEEALSLKD